MLYSIAKNRPLEVKFLSDKQRTRGSTLSANEILGVNTAFAIVWCFIFDEATEKSDKTRLEIFQDGFALPKCQHGSYEVHIYKMLHYSKFNGYYDIFAFAHILFLIESYTELTRKMELAGRLL